MLKTLSARIPAFNVGLAFLGSLMMAFCCWQTARDALIDAALERLQFAATAHKTSVEQIFVRGRSDIGQLAANRELTNNFDDLSEAMNPAGTTRQAIIDTFTAPKSRTERMSLDGRSQGGIYGARHAKIHDFALKIVAGGGYADMLLIDGKGVIIYTTAKGADFGQTITNAPYRTTGLAKVLGRLKNSNGSKVLYQDFAAYPGDSLPSAFLAMPVTRKANAAMGTDQETLTIGYVALRLQPSILSALADREGLGGTGQIYALGPDQRLLSAMPLDPSVHPGDDIAKVGLPANAITAGLPFSYTPLGQAARIAAVASVPVMDVKWTLVAERGKDDALLAVSALTRTLFICLIAVVAVTTVCGLVIARQIVSPITALVARMRTLAAGDIGSPIVGLDRQDELGAMAETVAVFRENALALERGKATAIEAERSRGREAALIEEERATVARKQAQVVESVASALSRLASGDLLHRLDSPFSAEYEQLRADFNDAVTTLQRTMANVLNSTNAIKSGTNEIASASNDLSRRTEQQAANLEETAAALNDIAMTVKQTAAGAVHARELVLQTTTNAQRSGEVVARTVAAMHGIEKFSAQISSIIGVIDEIAFQTNLLALNAGVEAARAGEAGRGFAVVASEVRALAQRSAEAAKEIKALIAASEVSVRSGVQLVDETGRSLTDIISQITDISQIIAQIAASAEHQATGISEVNIAVKQMDDVTQQNAAMVEEATAATHSLSEDSEKLVMAVEQFKITASNAGAATRPHDAPRGSNRLRRAS